MRELVRQTRARAASATDLPFFGHRLPVHLTVEQARSHNPSDMDGTQQLGGDRKAGARGHREGQALLDQIRADMPELLELLQKVESHWGGEDGFYRFYHGSLKVYWLQRHTESMVAKFKGIGGAAGLGETLNPQFMEIVGQGTGKTFDVSHNLDWGAHTRPILEAFFHAREMLRHMVKYGGKLEEAPTCLPSGWAAVLYLYGIR